MDIASSTYVNVAALCRLINSQSCESILQGPVKTGVFQTFIPVQNHLYIGPRDVAPRYKAFLAGSWPRAQSPGGERKAKRQHINQKPSFKSFDRMLVTKTEAKLPIPEARPSRSLWFPSAAPHPYPSNSEALPCSLPCPYSYCPIAVQLFSAICD